MSIRPDHWIRRMAVEHRMIEPYIDRQERDGVISYGVSSYGYDIRVADDFKVFTNVNNAIVDPKSFDPKSFVDFQGDICLIPPNSFALARTIEYIRMPRNVLGVVLGKSSYARCFRGDTRVALADGRALTLEQMADRSLAGATFRGYSIDPLGKLIVSRLHDPRHIGRDSLLAVTLDNGATVCCTPDHEFLLPEGALRQAHELRPGDALMTLCRDRSWGYERVYQPLTASLYPTHWLADEATPYAQAPQARRHHRARARHSHEVRWTERGPATAHAAPEGATRHAPLPEPLDACRPAKSHTVAHIKELPGQHDVYCLTVPAAGNFALEAGVFVKNCGIITNFTPLEPGWEGHITIEISNTTPLPARIYANEGIAQVLFFESDDPCEVSYDEKKGKYQGQQGITPPRL